MTELLQWGEILTDLGHLGAAFLLAATIGWNREQEEHNTGVRAFPIVCMASCALIMMASFHGDTAAQSRVLQGLVAGVGFIGGGAIVKEGATIRGAATAASVLAAAAVGAAVALDRFGIAVSLTLLTLAALRLLLPLKNRLDR